LSGAGVGVDRLRIADVGCGDGIMALGVARLLNPTSLVGFDINRTNTDELLRRARAQHAIDVLPDNLQFTESTPTHLPASDASFDLVYTWSAFEHVASPVDVLCEIRRVLRADGVLFLQLWPFYLSDRGSHLWNWFPQPFHHLLGSDEEIEAAMLAGGGEDDFMTGYMLEEYKKLNRVTLDELQDALLVAGFDVVRLELITYVVGLDPVLGRHHRLSDLGTGGVKLLARPRSESVARKPAVPDEVTDVEGGRED
jgi:SAM-dependent methyltransferase